MGIKIKKYRGQSQLQKLSTFTTWVIYFFLREFPGYFSCRLPTSSYTEYRIHCYNKAVTALRISIKEDYEYEKRVMLEERRKLRAIGGKK